MWKHKRPQIAKAVLRKKNEARGIHPFLLQTLLQSYSYQDSMVLAQKRNRDQWNKIESQEINPCTYGNLILTKEARTCNVSMTTSSINGAGKIGQLHVK